MYGKYERNGIVRQLKSKVVMNFKPFSSLATEIPLDANLAIADYEKMQNNTMAHLAFQVLDVFRAANGRLPKAWDKPDAEAFLSKAKELVEADPLYKEIKWEAPLIRLLALFSLTAEGVFNPLCAFQGGVVAQECVKAITQKFSPIGQLFYYDASEVLPEDFDLSVPDFSNWVSNIFKADPLNHRSDGLRIVLGGDMLAKLAHTRLFMVGAGAIGCELLKNYAMLGVGTGKAQPGRKAGAIVLTDPDVIEVSNLNRQFLFREKHLRNPKSSTAAAAAIYMNRELKENIVARLDKVHEGTAHIFTD